MSLLNKFQSITIQNDNRITEIDRAYCEKQEKMYREALEAMQQTLELFKSIYDSYAESDKSNYRTYIQKHDDIWQLEKRIESVKNSFISHIICHFQKAYNVTLSAEGIYKKYDTTVKYNNIVDEIFEQLGGFNFQEKAIKELKDKIRNTIYNSDKITINKGKLSIKDFLYWDSWSSDYKLSYSDSKVMPLFKALSHFETDETEMTFYYSTIYDKLYKGSREFDIFSKFEIGYNLVNSIKLFKNGKIEIEFENNQQAEQFKNEYLKK